MAYTGSADIENSGFNAIAKSYLADTSNTGAWYDNFWKKLGHAFINKQEAGVDVSYKNAINELQTFIDASEEDIFLSRNMNLNAIADALDVSYSEVFNASGEDLEQLKNQAQTVINSYQEIMDEALTNVQVAAEGYLKGVEDASGNLQSGYDHLSESKQNLVSMIVTNMSQDTADEILQQGDNANTAMRNYIDNLVDTIRTGGSDIEEAYSGIMNILSDPDNITSEGIEKIDSYIDRLSTATGESADNLKQMFGVDYLNDTEKHFKTNLKNIDKTSSAQKQLANYTRDFTNEQKEMWLSATQGCTTAKDAIEAYESAMANAVKGTTDGIFNIIDVIGQADSAYQKVLDIQGGEAGDYGDTYDSMSEMFTRAKELAEAGDIGTKEFKAIAEMLSPTGADDYTNWIENFPKVERYFTENTSDGMLNFLSDLEKKGYATQGAMGEWAISIEDLEDAARNLGIGFEPFMAIMDELSAKGFINDFISTPEEGMDHLTDLTKQLYEAESELYELEQNDPGNSTAIQAKKDEIDQLKSSIDSTTNSLEKLLNKTAEDRKAEFEKNKSTLSSVIDAFNTDDSSIDEIWKKQWADEIISMGGENGFAIQLGVDGKLYLDTTGAEASIAEVREETEADPIALTFELSNTDQIELANMAVKDLQKLGKTDIDFKFGTGNINVISAEIKSAQHILDEFRDSEGNVDLSLNGAQQAQVALAELLREKQQLNEPAVMSVDTAQLIGDAQTVLTDIQTLVTAVQEREVLIAVGADPSEADQVISDTLINLQANSEILSTIGVDTTTLDSTLAGIQNMDVEKTIELLAESSKYNRVVSEATNLEQRIFP